MRSIFYFLLFCSFTILCNSAFAQDRCGSDEVRARLIAENPAYKKSLEDMDRGIQQYIGTHPPTATSFTGQTQAAIYYIPCVVHVIYDTDPTVGSVYNPSDAQITAAINYINAVYDGTWTGTGGPILGAGDLQIKFVLATKDPNNNPTTGFDRLSGAGVPGYSTYGMMLNGTNGASEQTVKNLSRWDPEKYYNIWLVNKIDGCNGVFCGCACDAGFVAGYAYFPMDPTSSTAADDIKYDGTLMLASQMGAGRKTLPHELGHMLNLYHPFEGNDPLGTGANTCPLNVLPAAQGDEIPDTDPITSPYLAPNTPFVCRTGTNPCTGTPFTDNTEKNYMNYTNCFQLFTNDQKARMQATLATTQRSSLATSWANNQGTYPAAFSAPIAATTTPSSLLTVNNIAGIFNTELVGPGFDKKVYSFNATNDGGYLNNSGKWYDAFVLNANTAYTFSVTIGGSNRQQLGVWIDYNNNGLFNNTNEQIYLNTDIATTGSTTTVNIPFTTPASWAGNSNFVRVRITEDLSTVYGVTAISNTSASLQYGQAEDYPVYLTGGVVPVSLISFTGTQAKDAISLQWQTAQEINTAVYDIERSVKAGSFRSIGSVNAAGSAAGAAYTFRDADVSAPGEYLYRLKIKDHDGSFSYSNILKFHVEEQKKLIVVGNPFTSYISLLLPYSNGSAAFRLMDAAGRIVYSNSISLGGSNTFMLHLEKYNLSKGVYILDAIINGERFTAKVVKN